MTVGSFVRIERCFLRALLRDLKEPWITFVRIVSLFGVLVVSIQFVWFLNCSIAHRFRHRPYCVVATMELIALMTVVVSICDHRSFRYYSEAWQSEHHRASCDYSYPICGAWGNHSTTWDNPTTVSLMALYDSGEFCLTVLFDAVASLSNSYLDMDFMGQVWRSLCHSDTWNLLFSFVSLTLVPNGQPMLKHGLLWCCCWCCRSCCCCLPLPLLLLLSLLSWFSVMHVCHYVVRLSTRYMCGYSHTGFAALAPMIRLLFMGFIKNKKHQM